jgi:hypothetical protein
MFQHALRSFIATEAARRRNCCRIYGTGPKARLGACLELRDEMETDAPSGSQRWQCYL